MKRFLFLVGCLIVGVITLTLTIVYKAYLFPLGAIGALAMLASGEALWNRYIDLPFNNKW